MAQTLIGPDGRKYTLEAPDPATLADLQREGFRPETGEAPQTLGEKVHAGVLGTTDALGAAGLGVASGLTGGLSDAALAKGVFNAPIEGLSGPQSGGDWTRDEETKKRDALVVAHPIAHGVGEFGGMMLNPVNEVGAVAGAGVKGVSLASKLGAHVLSGAVGQGLMGAEQGVSESVLGDTPITAEKMLSNVGLSGVLGGLGGGVGGALAEGAGAAVGKLTKTLEKSSDTLEEFASNKALKAAGATKRDLDYLGEDRAKEVGKVLLEREHLGTGASAPTAKDVLESVSKDKQAVGAERAKMFDDAEAVGAKADFAPVVAKLDAFEASLPPLQREAIAGDVAKARRAAEEYSDKAGGFKALDELKRDLQSKAKWSAADPSQEFAGKLRRQLSGVVRDELDQQFVQHLGADAGKAFLENSKTYGLLADAERVAEHGAEKLGGNASIGLRDALAGAGLLAHGNPVSALVGAIASKVMRERGNGVIARLASKLSDSPAMSAIATSFAQKAGAAAPMLGQAGAVLGAALAKSPQEALATHMVMSQTDPHYAEAAQMSGLVTPSSPEQATAGVVKAHGLAQIAASIASHDERVDSHISRAVKGADRAPIGAGKLGSTDFSGKRSRASGRDLHNKRVDEIRQLATNPQALVDRIAASTGNLAGIAPALTGAVTSTANNAIQYLAKAAQEPLKAGPLAADWHHTEAERQSFARKLAVVEDPMVALKHAASGTLTPDEMEAFRAVYPGLAQEVANKVIERITESPKSVPYKQRIMLSLLTGADLDGTMNQVSIAANQAAIAAGKKKDDAQAPNAPAGGADKLTLGKRMAPGKTSESQQEA